MEGNKPPYANWTGPSLAGVLFPCLAVRPSSSCRSWPRIFFAAVTTSAALCRLWRHGCSIGQGITQTHLLLRPENRCAPLAGCASLLATHTLLAGSLASNGRLALEMQAPKSQRQARCMILVMPVACRSIAGCVHRDSRCALCAGCAGSLASNSTADAATHEPPTAGTLHESHRLSRAGCVHHRVCLTRMCVTR